MRWSLIKSSFLRSIPKLERVRESRQRKRERGIWQRRYWEHQIRDDVDLQKHVDYIHFNPVKHGHAKKPADWPYSTIHRDIAKGILVKSWGVSEIMEGDFGE